MNTHPERQPQKPLEENPDPGLEPESYLAESIRLFRSAMDHVAQRETVRPMTSQWLEPAKLRQRNAQRRLFLSWACAALVCIAVLPISLHLRQHGAVAAPSVIADLGTESDEAMADTRLLEQVDSAVSESVPMSLAPLAALDSWNSTTSANQVPVEPSLPQTEKKNVNQ